MWAALCFVRQDHDHWRVQFCPWQVKGWANPPRWPGEAYGAGIAARTQSEALRAPTVAPYAARAAIA